MSQAHDDQHTLGIRLRAPHAPLPPIRPPITRHDKDLA